MQSALPMLKIRRWKQIIYLTFPLAACNENGLFTYIFNPIALLQMAVKRFKSDSKIAIGENFQL